MILRQLGDLAVVAPKSRGVHLRNAYRYVMWQAYDCNGDSRYHVPRVWRRYVQSKTKGGLTTYRLLGSTLNCHLGSARECTKPT